MYIISIFFTYASCTILIFLHYVYLNRGRCQIHVHVYILNLNPDIEVTGKLFIGSSFNLLTILPSFC